MRGRFLNPLCATGARINAAQQMNLDGPKRLRASPHQRDKEAPGTLGSSLALRDGTYPYDAAGLIERPTRDHQGVVRPAHFVAGAGCEIEMHNVARIQTASA